jgi:cation diffusion facilitator family transporter
MDSSNKSSASPSSSCDDAGENENSSLQQGSALAGLTPLARLLAKRFVPNCDLIGDRDVRTRYGKMASIVCIICNVLLSVCKGIIGAVAGSISIVADAVNNLSDASSNIVSLFGFKLASKPADDEHPYGHGRFEYLSGMIVAVIVVAIGIELVITSIKKIANPSVTDFGWAVVAVLVLSIAVKLWMAYFNSSLGKLIDSTTLRATAVDSRNDVISTAAVLASAIISAATGFDLDGWAGLAVGAFIVVSGIGLVRDTVDPLLGRAPDPKLVKHIHDVILSYPGVLGTHDLMVHDYGPGRQFASAHVEMAAEEDVLKSHDVIDNIEQDFKRNDGLIMTIHYDPIVTNDPAVHDLRNWIATHITSIDPRLTIHDLRTVPGPTHTNVIFDCVKPHDLAMTDSELADRITRIVREKNPQANCVITFDSSYVSSEQ